MKKGQRCGKAKPQNIFLFYYLLYSKARLVNWSSVKWEKTCHKGNTQQAFTTAEFYELDILRTTGAIMCSLLFNVFPLLFYKATLECQPTESVYCAGIIAFTFTAFSCALLSSSIYNALPSAKAEYTQSHFTYTIAPSNKQLQQAQVYLWLREGASHLHNGGICTW